MKKSIILASEIGMQPSLQNAVEKFDNGPVIEAAIYPGCQLVLDLNGQFYSSPIKSKFSWSIQGASGGIWGSGSGGAQLWPIDPAQEYLVQFGLEGTNSVSPVVRDVTFRTEPGSKCKAILISRSVTPAITNCSFQYFKHGVSVWGTKANLSTLIQSCNFDRCEVGIFVDTIGDLTTSSHSSSACMTIQNCNFSQGKVGIFLNPGVRSNVLMSNLIQGQEVAGIVLRKFQRVTMISNYIEMSKNENGIRPACLVMFERVQVKMVSGEVSSCYKEAEANLFIDGHEFLPSRPSESPIKWGSVDRFGNPQFLTALPVAIPSEYLY